MKLQPIGLCAVSALIPGGLAMAAGDPVADKFARMQQEIAANPEQGQAATETGGVHPLMLGVEVVLGLAFVLVLAVFTIRFLKKLQGGMLRGPMGTGGDLLEVVETCHLGPGQRILAVRMGDRIGVMGAGKEGINLLHLLDQPAANLLAGRQTNPQAFSDNLNRLMDKFKKPKKVSELLDGK